MFIHIQLYPSVHNYIPQHESTIVYVPYINIKYMCQVKPGDTTIYLMMPGHAR